MTDTMSEYLRSKGRALVEDYIGGNEVQQPLASNIPTSSRVIPTIATIANPIAFVQVISCFFCF